MSTHSGHLCDAFMARLIPPPLSGTPSSPPLPFLDKDRPSTLVFDDEGSSEGGAHWLLRRADGSVAQRYAEDDLRSSIVYRARCFSSAEEATRFGGVGGPEEQMLELEDVLKTLAKELVRRGAVNSVDAAMKMDRLDLAKLIMDWFIAYPLPPRWQPYNYCALALAWPPSARLLSLVC